MPNQTDSAPECEVQGSSLRTVYSLSFREIASWTPGVCENVHGAINASVPALQRGLVWNPQQNELLWDSILRGFPIGALVVTKWSKELKKTSEGESGQFTHHLLDGQQRCNAIAMGYADPFSEKESSDRNKSESILWLDLDPDSMSQGNSTRNFWIRVTTLAHPWGYSCNDSASPLSTESIREALNQVGMNPSQSTYKRPSPIDLWPCSASANIPVPLSWLLQLPLNDEENFWKALGVRAEKKKYPWSEKVHQFCVNPDVSESKKRIYKGLKRVETSGVIALKAPEELLEGSEQEKSTGGAREDVSNIEQLFQRLNQQGTRLDGEELAYSMIKAYWPDLEQPINTVSAGRMPQARMVSLGIRAALAKAAEQNLPAQQTVSQVRAIARSEDEKKRHIQKFISQDLGGACDRVGKWLKYDPIENHTGLLPVHITSIAMGSREVYLLLLHFAERMEGIESPQSWCKVMQALASVIHWFALDKAKVANRVFSLCKSQLSIESIKVALKQSIEEGELPMIQPSKNIEGFLQLDKDGFKDWNWWSPIHGDGIEEDILLRQKKWQELLKFRFNREMLLYAQRDFLSRRFHDYDPARKDLWEAHNRPWDFDHILAWKYLYHRKGDVPFKGVCDEWCYTIGNFRAWPFEDNRSDQALSARKKLSPDGILVKSLLNDSFIKTDEVDGFSGENSVRVDEEAAYLFVKSCRSRLLRIYKSWYDSMQIDQLIIPLHNLDG